MCHPPPPSPQLLRVSDMALPCCMSDMALPCCVSDMLLQVVGLLGRALRAPLDTVTDMAASLLSSGVAAPAWYQAPA